MSIDAYLPQEEKKTRMHNSMDELIAEDEEDMEREAAMWRGVTDQSSGKTYYYHVVSRESVWDKPLALCSAQER